MGDRLATIDMGRKVEGTLRQITSYGQFRRHLKTHLFRAYETTAHCDFYFWRYKYTYLLTYLLIYMTGQTTVR